MTTRAKSTWVILTAALALWAGPAAALTATLAPGSKLWLEGDSTLHPYRSEASTINLTLDLQGPSPLADLIKGKAPAQMIVRIPVAALKSEHKGLDKNLQAALGAKAHPDIVFTLSSFELMPDGKDLIVAVGQLSVAGVTKPETLNATLSWKDGRAVVDGEQTLFMTNFGVKPPTMMMGSIKTADKVVVKFHLELAPVGFETKTGK